MPVVSALRMLKEMNCPEFGTSQGHAAKLSQIRHTGAGKTVWSYECVLLLQKSRVQLTAPASRDSKPPVTPTGPGVLTSSSGYLYTYAHTYNFLLIVYLGQKFSGRAFI